MSSGIQSRTQTFEPVDYAPPPSKTHDWTHQQKGIDYVIEAATPDGIDKTFYMTGQKRGIKQFDCILLSWGSTPTRYRVEKIDYYCHPPDMWVALLTQLP